MDLTFFDRIIPNFTLSIVRNHTNDQYEIAEFGELGAWLRHINSDELFKLKFVDFVKHTKSESALAMINGTVDQIRCVFVYLIKKQILPNKIEVKVYNLVELSHLISHCFDMTLWAEINTIIAENHALLIQRNLITGYLALEPLFTLCYNDFHDGGKSKYDFGETLFYLNHKYNWSRANAGMKENSGRVILQQISGNKASKIPERITKQCIANHQLESNLIFCV
jgi:hypothetical protein